MDSLWTHDVCLPSFPRLEGDLETDVLVIGGGLCGVLCAYRLQEAGVRYALIEAERICHGVTARTTAKLTSQHGLIYHDLLRRFGPERARQYYDVNEAALERYRALCRTMDCGFEERDAYVYEAGGTKKLEEEMAALDRLGIPANGLSRLPLPVPAAGAIRFRQQAQFHPLRFVREVVKGLNIYEHTAARAYDGRAIVTDSGRITARRIIVATHFPMFNKHGAYFLKLYQHRSYVLALEGAQDVHGMFVDERETGLSLRNAEGLLLLGGGAHRTGRQGGGWNELSAFAREHYPGAREVRRWATQDCMTLDGVPYIGRYAKGTPSLYVATGFGKWGMTTSMVAADLLCDLVQDLTNECAALFSPTRSMLHAQLLVNGLEACASLLTPTRPRCPHMGCALKWNPQERSWDCPATARALRRTARCFAIRRRAICACGERRGWNRRKRSGGKTMETRAEFDAFFAGRPQEWTPAEALRTALLARWPGTTMRAMKTCLSFDDPKPYCYLSHPPRKGMRGVMVTFSLPEPVEHPRFFMVVPVGKRRFTVHVLLTDAAQADEELLGFIAASRR